MQAQMPRDKTYNSSEHTDFSQAVIATCSRFQRENRIHDALSALKKASDDSHIEFLFEIPAGLFAKPDLAAAAILVPDDKLNDQFLFVLCEPEGELVSVLSIDEIPASARSFFSSYIEVLSSLSKIPAVQKLH